VGLWPLGYRLLILGGIVGFKGWKRRSVLRWLRCPTANEIFIRLVFNKVKILDLATLHYS
jgi:hypothetical protein